MELDSEGFPARIAAVIKLFRNKTEAAETAGVTLQQLRRWTKNTGVDPSLFKIAALAKEKDVSLSWLVTGHGSMLDFEQKSPIAGGVSDTHAGYEALNPEALRLALETAEEAITIMNRQLTPEKKAKLTMLMYKEFVADTADGVKQSNIIDLLKIMKESK